MRRWSRQALQGSLVLAILAVLGIAVANYDSGALMLIFIVVVMLALVVLGLKWPGPVFGLFLVSGEFTLSALVDIDIGFALGAVVFMLVVAESTRRGFPRIPITAWLIVAIAVMLLLGVTYSVSPEYGLHKAVRFVSLGLLAATAPAFLIRDEETLYSLLSALWVLGLGIAIVAVASSLTGSGSGRLVSFGGGPITLGRLSGIALLCTPAIVGRNLGLRRVVILSVPILIWAVLGSGSRGPLLSLVASAGLVAVAAMAQRRTKKPHLVAAIISLGGVITVLWRFLPESLLSRYALLTSTNPGASVTAREQMLAASWRLGGQNLIAGVGTGSFGVAASMQPNRYPHNIIAEVFSENGVVTASLLMLTFLVGVLGSLRRALWSSSRLWWVVTAITLFGMGNAMVSGDVNDNQVLLAMLTMPFVVKTAN